MIEFMYEDADNTILIDATPSETIIIPKNVVRIKDSTVASDSSVSIRTLEALKNVLKYLSFEEESLLEDLGIGTFSFFTQLISVNLSMCNHLKQISSAAFIYSNLNQIFLPMNGVLGSIKSAAFFQTNLKNIYIPDTVTQISGYYNDQVKGGPFTNCKYLTNIFISESSSLTSIGDSIGQFSAVTNIFIPKNCKIKNGAFNFMNSLEVTIDLRNPYLRIYNKCIYSYDYRTFYWIPYSYTDFLTFYPNCSVIASYAFMGYSTKQDIVIPPSISTINSEGLRECNCRSIIFQNDMIESPNFGIFCYSTSPIKMPSKLKVVRSNLFLLYAGSYIEFFSDIERIDSYSFINCSGVQQIKFHKLKNNMIIQSNSFKNCPKLKHLLFPIESNDIITFNSTCLSDCNSFIGVRFYLTISRNMMNFNVNTNAIDIDVRTTNANGDSIDCGKFQIKKPFDEKCNVPIHSCNRFSVAFNIPNINIFIIIFID